MSKTKDRAEIHEAETRNKLMQLGHPVKRLPALYKGKAERLRVLKKRCEKVGVDPVYHVGGEILW